ncbi:MULTISPECIES: hypothetical protein [Nocardiaceae]|jgi:hypothetical protein|uniref:hypothetical protein n=1 Tax=Nocardiaceae TaxID=85025 RepID=UPI0005D8C9C1|nr:MULTISPECIES: hypothetical protein [Rhodococcus]AJW42687.1 hypothetical protein NY08_4687 [Rhodococcus sp. B7740]
MSESPIETPTEDRVEQSLPIVDESGEPSTSDLPVEADVRDVLDQRAEVPLDDDGYDER